MIQLKRRYAPEGGTDTVLQRENGETRRGGGSATRRSYCRSEKSWLLVSSWDAISLSVTVLLCLPSLIGGGALLINLLLYRSIAEWSTASSALVALGSFLGGPLVALAAVVGGIIAFRRTVSFEIKCAHLFVVVLATIATFYLLLQFGS